MPLTLTCLCGKRLQCRDEDAGNRVKCPACGAVLLVATAGTSPPSPAQSPPTAQQVAVHPPVTPPPSPLTHNSVTSVAQGDAGASATPSPAATANPLLSRRFLLKALAAAVWLVVVAGVYLFAGALLWGKWRACGECRGKGTTTSECFRCLGRGYYGGVRCPKCDGTGKVKGTCRFCAGSGRKP
jgi:hypothetical protein